MLQLTVSDIIYGDWGKLNPSNEPVCIYVVKDEESVLYIGRSGDPFNRMLEHFGRSLRSSGASLGEFYKEFEHESNSWIIEMYSLEECKNVTKEKCNNINKAEVMMILHFKPCLNERNNPDPSPLPEKYKRQYYPENVEYAFGHLIASE